MMVGRHNEKEKKGQEKLHAPQEKSTSSGDLPCQVAGVQIQHPLACAWIQGKWPGILHDPSPQAHHGHGGHRWG